MKDSSPISANKSRFHISCVLYSLFYNPRVLIFPPCVPLCIQETTLHGRRIRAVYIALLHLSRHDTSHDVYILQWTCCDGRTFAMAARRTTRVQGRSESWSELWHRASTLGKFKFCHCSVDWNIMHNSAATTCSLEPLDFLQTAICTLERLTRTSPTAIATKKYSDTGNRTPSYRDLGRPLRGGNVSRYTISDAVVSLKCVI